MLTHDLFCAGMPPPRHLALFHPRLVRERISALEPGLFAKHAHAIAPWLDHLKRGTLDETKEVSLHAGFLERVFGDVLGYRTMATAEASHWDLVAEKGMQGGSADGALGYFEQNTARVLAPVELKGAAQFLDHAKGRSLTPIQQGWDYANRTPESRWIIVSNYRETRLYAKSRGPGAYEAFMLEELGEETAFLRFCALLSRASLLGPGAPEHAPLVEMLVRSEHVEREITEKLYAQYRGIRGRLFEELRVKHSNEPHDDLLRHAQEILDRVLFVAFAEDRGLLPPDTLESAYDYSDPYYPRPKWQNFLAVFRSIDTGNAALNINGYNGGLFRDIDSVAHYEISDDICKSFKELGTYDYSEEVSVDVLGHVFEQSIADLEQLRRDAASNGSVAPPASADGAQKKPSKRKAEGIFYTPAFVTSYLVRETLGRVIAATWDKSGLDRPGSKAERIAAWEAYRSALRDVRVLDPACGSGAFLAAAFDVLAAEIERANRALSELRDGGQTTFFDLDKTVLNECLFGLDKERESVEITKLSLWLKTAAKGKKLTFLDCNIRQGNTVVSDPNIDPLAFDWGKGHVARDMFDLEPPPGEDTATYDARWRAGFDVVIGNPPYVRQELVTIYKEHWSKTFDAYDGAADLFVYFIERGIKQLKPGGRLGFIVSNKWLKGGYAEKLRELLGNQCTIESIVDFGHAPIFPDADAFPCILTLRKEAPAHDHAVQVTLYPRELVHTEEIATYVDKHRFALPQKSLAKTGWTLERPGVRDLMAKLVANGTPLGKFAAGKPLRGLLTGLNEAFFIDAAEKDRLCRTDGGSVELFAPYMRGQDIARWSPDWKRTWIILLASSENRAWPWAAAKDEPDAERLFAATYPALHAHMKRFEERLRVRSDRGRFWWELRSCTYYESFARPKLVWPDILWKADFCLGDANTYLNNTSYFLPGADAWVLACLNSPVMWSYLWRSAQHAKDEALRMFTEYVVTLPIAPVPRSGRFAENVAAVTTATREAQSRIANTLDVLRIEDGIDTPGNALSDFPSLDFDAFATEVKKRRPKGSPRVTPAALAELRKLFDVEAGPIREQRGRILALERTIAAEVHAAYGLDAADLALMRETAPPRMPPGWDIR